MGNRYLESDEFYLAGGEPHLGDAAIDEARAEQWADQYGEYGDRSYDDPYAAQLGDRRSTQSRLWNRYTPGWSSGFNSGFGNPYGYGNPYGFGGMGTGGWGSAYGMGFGNTYGYNNMAFMNGYDAWGNPIGGFGNPGFGWGNGWGNGWGYDPWGGGYWGAPGYGYGYNPYYGGWGGYGNPYGVGGFCGTGSGGGGISTITPPRPRPSLGQFTGNNVYTGGSQAGGTGGMDGAGAGDSDQAEPQQQRNTTRTYTEGRSNDSGRSLPAYQPERSEPQRDAIDRSNRNNRSEGNRNRWTAPAPRENRTSPSNRGGGNNWSQPAPRQNISSPSPRPSSGGSGGGRSTSGRSGRGG